VARLPVATLAASLLAFALDTRAGASALSSGGAIGRAHDAEARGALALVYDGAFAAAESRLEGLAGAHPDDPVLPYLQALALEWRLEQDPASRAHDPDVLALADRSLSLAEAALGRDRADRRARLARGAAHGVKSRLHLFRWERGGASREAVRMRETLAAARAEGEDALDLDFGLGLYDYYADTLPRFFKVVAFVLRIPGGDRERGILAIARVARGGSLFHDDEARVQMYDIHSYFERRPDRAVHWIREMWRLHPGWPIWGLKLAQLLGEPMGLWADSAAVCREIVSTAERGAHPNYQPVVAEMARALLAEALLGDLRFEEACGEARRPGGGPGARWVAERREKVLARCIALERGAGSAEVRALALLARARRLGERGEEREAEATCLEAFRLDPASDEARLCAARESLRAGRPAAARALARAVLDGDGDAGLRPPARLVLARALESEGSRAKALSFYRRAWEEPLGRAAVRAEAAAGVKRLEPGASLPQTPAEER
jgi:tetratricopeptide (TPR) repeat protein